MGNQATNFCIFVKEKEYLHMKDSNEDIVKWRAKNKTFQFIRNKLRETFYGLLPLVSE